MTSLHAPRPVSPLTRMRQPLRRLPVHRCEVLVLGSGVSGLAAALGASAEGAHVMVLSKGALDDTNTARAQGGIAAAVGPEDAASLHAADTLRLGYGLSDPLRVAGVTDAGPDAIHWLMELGMEFDRGPEGQLDLGKEGGHRIARILHSGGTATGRVLQRTLLAAVRSRPQVDLFPHAHAVELLRDAEGEVAGVLALLGSGPGSPREPVVFEARAVVLATGGGGQLFRETTNPRSATADGLALALRAGAELRDLEFVQFHPTTLYLAGAARFLISEVTRGAGGVLRDRSGAAFMAEVHPDADLAPRDVVSRAIFRRMVETGATHVWLDLREVPDAGRRFPELARICSAFGIDLASQPIPVRPAAHYFVGGVAADAAGRTRLPGLWAVGECASTGFHGANRMGSNSLLEGLVEGRTVGRRAANALRPRIRRFLPPSDLGSRLDAPYGAELELADMTYSLKSLMWRQVGIERDAEGLADAVERLDAWAGYLASLGPFTPEGVEVVDMVQVAQVLARSAWFRTESRGAHFRRDFPEPDPAWRAHTRVLPGEDGIDFEAEPVTSADSPVAVGAQRR